VWLSTYYLGLALGLALGPTGLIVVYSSFHPLITHQGHEAVCWCAECDGRKYIIILLVKLVRVDVSS